MLQNKTRRPLTARIIRVILSFMYLDPYYLVLVVPTIFLSLWAQFTVKSAFSKYSRIRCSRGITGAGAAQILMDANDISNVRIEPVAGSLTDHYDPAHRVLRLSEQVYDKPSIAAVGVAAHETGHAIQHARGYGPLGLRSTLVPVANIGSTIGPWLALGGIVMSFQPLLTIGIILFAGAVAFYLITLPVEFNASSRALAILEENQVLDSRELAGVKKVLSAAAMTYVASALTAVMSLLRLILLARRRR
jgi:Zn-dependent membrane protease YugP